MTSLQYEGVGFFRQRLLLSLLSGKSFSLQHVRGSLTQTHANLLRLLNSLTSGTTIRISKSPMGGGTDTLHFVPGAITGAQYLTHECTLDRGLAYWIEPLLILLLYAKRPSSVTLRGCTNCPSDPSIDMIRNCTCGLFAKFGFQEGSSQHEGAIPSVQIIARGIPPGGGGEVRILSPILRRPVPCVVLSDPGLIRRIRGVAYSANVSGQLGRRMVTAAKGVLLRYIPNVYLATDHYTGRSAGKSPGFGLYIEAETTNECRLGVQVSAGVRGGSIPEDVGVFAAKALFEEILLGGCIDRPTQWIALLLMSLSVDSRPSRIRLGSKITSYSVELLRHVRDFLGVVFHVEVGKHMARRRRNRMLQQMELGGGVLDEENEAEEEEEPPPEEQQEDEEETDLECIMCTCVGCGLQNLAWKSS